MHGTQPTPRLPSSYPRCRLCTTLFGGCNGAPFGAMDRMAYGMLRRAILRKLASADDVTLAEMAPVLDLHDALCQAKVAQRWPCQLEPLGTVWAQASRPLLMLDDTALRRPSVHARRPRTST